MDRTQTTTGNRAGSPSNPEGAWEDTQQAARRAGHEAAREVAGAAARGKERTRSELAAVAGALRAAGDSLERDGDGRLSGYADRAARQTDRLAGYLENRDLEAMVADLRDFARRRPELALGGLFVAGIALGRLLRSQPPKTDRRWRGGEM